VKAPRVKDPKRVAAGRRSKRKGNSNEREVARLLREWWGEGEFMRTPSSGGWGRSRQVRDDFNAAGDIVTTATDFPFCAEVKSEEGWELEQLLRSPDKCPIAKWWKQAEEETPAGKHPLLLFTRKLRPWFCLMDHEALASSLWTRAVRTGQSVWFLQVKGRTLYLTLLETLTSLPREQVLSTLGTMTITRKPMP
jgi:hypothetical protein